MKDITLKSHVWWGQEVCPDQRAGHRVGGPKRVNLESHAELMGLDAGSLVTEQTQETKT